MRKKKSHSTKTEKKIQFTIPLVYTDNKLRSDVCLSHKSECRMRVKMNERPLQRVQNEIISCAKFKISVIND